MTREEVLSIEEYCAEHRISHKKHRQEESYKIIQEFEKWMDEFVNRMFGPGGVWQID